MRSYFPAIILAALAVMAEPRAWAQQPSAADSASPPPVTGLVPDHATLSVENLELEAAWYQRVLGFKIYSRSEANPDMRNWHLVIPGYRIDMVKFKGSHRDPDGPSVYSKQGWTHVVFHVPDVAQALKTLQALHVDTQVNRDPKGVPIQILIRDPEGNQIEIRRDLLV
ncbi:MAG TPA: VOC family protein [Caulobacteraceae bacterium]|nr:VOC family protein [Caulobacteraceae bacterium]